MKKNAFGIGTPLAESGSPRKQYKHKLNLMQTEVGPYSRKPHQTAASQIVPKFFLDPHLTKCRWGTPILEISTLCVEIHNMRLANDLHARTFSRDRNASNKLPCSAFDGNTSIYTIYMIDIYLSMRKLFKNL